MATEYTTWGDLFYHIHPYNWAQLGIFMALGLSILGAGW